MATVLMFSTGAATVQQEDAYVHLDGANNVFNILISGSTNMNWIPGDSDWAQANSLGYNMDLGGDEGLLLHPGSIVKLRVAVKNGSPKLDGLLTLNVVDPDPHGDELDPLTGNHKELFDQLVFTVKEGDTVLVDRVPAPELRKISWAENAFPAGEVKILDVDIQVPETLGNQWQQASTDIQFQFEAENL